MIFYGICNVHIKINNKISTLLLALVLLMGGSAYADTPAFTHCRATTDQIFPQDCQFLVELYREAKGEQWKRQRGWNKTSTPCRWDGVTCTSFPNDLSQSRRVIKLRLDRNGLEGGFPVSLLGLSELKVLNLADNNLQGRLPQTINKLRKLESFNVKGNQLTGTIPTSFGQLQRLKTLNLAGGGRHDNQGGNRFDGPIPIELGALTQLENLHLHANRLTGSIPTSFEALKSLKRFTITDNKLTSTLPSFISSWSQLQDLDLSHNTSAALNPGASGQTNRFSGEIPTGICELKRLKSLKITNHRRPNGTVSGTIPDCIGNMKSLEVLVLSFNRLTGELPESINELSQLEQLEVSDNSLKGQVVLEFSKLRNLTTMSFQNNPGLRVIITEELMDIPDFYSLSYHKSGLCFEDTPRFREFISSPENRTKFIGPTNFCSLP